MNREDIKRIVSDLNVLLRTTTNRDYKECLLDSIECINQLEADKMEAYKAIVEVLAIQKKNYGHGMDLHLDMITFADEQKQLKLKAEQYIEDNK